ncbi:MAG: pseudouridine synthase [Cyanobacteria bacterium J06621_11]
MNQGWTYYDRIQPHTAGQTILAYYTQRYTHSSQADWQTRIDQQQILLNGKPTQPQTILKNGHQLSYYRLPWEEPTAPLAFSVLYEDKHLWVINKPSGLPVLPGGGFLENTLLHQLRSRYPTETPIPVHRLGRGTSGAILIAKTQTARAHLAKQFRTRSATHNSAYNAPQHTTHGATRPPSVKTPKNSQTLTKIYRALVGPTTSAKISDRFTCTYPIGKLPHHKIGHIYGHSPTGLPAHSECTVLQRSATSTLLDVSISTGRPHQIRIHLAAAGFPLLKDPLYPIGGAPTPNCTARPGDVGYYLHAHQLRFIHPQTGHPISITAPPPAILQLSPH